MSSGGHSMDSGPHKQNGKLIAGEPGEEYIPTRVVNITVDGQPVNVTVHGISHERLVASLHTNKKQNKPNFFKILGFGIIVLLLSYTSGVVFGYILKLMAT